MAGTGAAAGSAASAGGATDGTAEGTEANPFGPNHAAVSRSERGIGVRISDSSIEAGRTTTIASSAAQAPAKAKAGR